MIYTRKGDDGTTSLVGGTRVRKDDLRVEVYGTLDELNSYVGLIRELTDNATYKAQLQQVQNLLFNAESLIACEDMAIRKMLPKIEDRHITDLENAIDDMMSQLPVLKQFVLPGGSVLAAHTNICRTICRRVERLCVRFKSDGSENVENNVLRFINRLSDYLFVFSRKVIYANGMQENYWNKMI
jgi:cob(I)alamin adenosyltransferase